MFSFLLCVRFVLLVKSCLYEIIFIITSSFFRGFVSLVDVKERRETKLQDDEATWKERTDNNNNNNTLKKYIYNFFLFYFILFRWFVIFVFFCVSLYETSTYLVLDNNILMIPFGSQTLLKSTSPFPFFFFVFK